MNLRGRHTYGYKSKTFYTTQGEGEGVFLRADVK